MLTQTQLFFAGEEGGGVFLWSGLTGSWLFSPRADQQEIGERLRFQFRSELDQKFARVCNLISSSRRGGVFIDVFHMDKNTHKGNNITIFVTPSLNVCGSLIFAEYWT